MKKRISNGKKIKSISEFLQKFCEGCQVSWKGEVLPNSKTTVKLTSENPLINGRTLFFCNDLEGLMWSLDGVIYRTFVGDEHYTRIK